MKRANLRKLKYIAVLTSVSTLLSFQPAQAVQFATTMGTTCNGTGATSTWSVAIPFNIPETATVTKVDQKASSGTLSTNYILIKADNAGAPTGSTLGTFNYSSNSGLINSFTGSADLNGAGRYWLIFRQTSSVSLCFSTTPVYTGTPAGWTLGATYTWQSTDSGASYASRGDYMVLLFTLYGTGGGVAAPTSSISLSSVTSINFHQSITVNASLGVAGTDGKVTFFANGKRIPGCVAKQSVSLATSCTFKPSRRGALAVIATLSPLDTNYSSSVSPAKNIVVVNRSTIR
jgi:hypothetical protein